MLMFIPDTTRETPPMPTPFTILGIAGSLRQQSHSRASLLAARELLPEGVVLQTFDLQGIPLQCQGHRLEGSPRVAEFKREIRAADAVLFSAPEYLYGLLTVLDNAIESAAQPLRDNAWAGKAVAVIGASESEHGMARAQHHLRRSLVELNMIPLPQPPVLICNARRAFNAQGQLIDPAMRQQLRQLLADLVRSARSFTMPDPNTTVAWLPALSAGAQTARATGSTNALAGSRGVAHPLQAVAHESQCH